MFLIAEKVQCHHHIEVNPWYMVTQVDRAIRYLDEAGLLHYHHIRSLDTFDLLLYKELRDVGETVPTHQKFTWGPVRMGDSTISRMFIFMLFMDTFALTVLFGELLVHRRKKIRSTDVGCQARRWNIVLTKSKKIQIKTESRNIKKKKYNVRKMLVVTDRVVRICLTMKGKTNNVSSIFMRNQGKRSQAWT